MAKISELSDAQLDKAYVKYRTQYKQKPSPQLKKAILQIDAERKKRKAAAVPDQTQEVQLEDSSPSQTVNLAELSKSATFIVDKSKVAQKKQEDKKISNKLRKGQGPAIGKKLTNILIGGGGVLTAIGLVLILDHFLLEFLPYFMFKSFLMFFFAVIGMVMMKTGTHLSDDNR